MLSVNCGISNGCVSGAAIYPVVLTPARFVGHVRAVVVAVEVPAIPARRGSDAHGELRSGGALRRNLGCVLALEVHSVAAAFELGCGIIRPSEHEAQSARRINRRDDALQLLVIRIVGRGGACSRSR